MKDILAVLFALLVFGVIGWMVFEPYSFTLRPFDGTRLAFTFAIVIAGVWGFLRISGEYS